MDLSKFNYNLPKEKIALYPQEKRGESRLLVVDRKSKVITHGKYSDLPNFFKRDDVAVINDTKVLNTRLWFKDKRSKIHEVVFLPTREGVSEALISRAKKLGVDDILLLKNNEDILIKIIKKESNSSIWEVEWSVDDPEVIFQKYGHVPLPPYIEREDEESDKLRYNTIFASSPGSAAAPTASLNLTPEILNQLGSYDESIAEVTLHVGWGTFAPIREKDIEDHQIHSEWFNLEKEQAEKVNKAKRRGGQVWALGSTSTRVLESCATDKKDSIEPKSGYTDLYIYPGYDWQIVDVLVTNFHAPGTSLLTLVASFMGYNLMIDAYKEALDRDYKFLSYGDSMLIL